MNIGKPKRVIEVEPTSVPIPESLPESAPSEGSPTEVAPVGVPAEDLAKA